MLILRKKTTFSYICAAWSWHNICFQIYILKIYLYIPNGFLTFESIERKLISQTDIAK